LCLATEAYIISQTWLRFPYTYTDAQGVVRTSSWRQRYEQILREITTHYIRKTIEEMRSDVRDLHF
jgi:hypothetical protein